MHEINKDELKHSRITIFEFSTDTVRQERKRRKKSDEQSYCQVGIDSKEVRARQIMRFRYFVGVGTRCLL